MCSEPFFNDLTADDIVIPIYIKVRSVDIKILCEFAKIISQTSRAFEFLFTDFYPLLSKEASLLI